MAKRGAASQDAFERSPKRTQLIEITSDSDSELPNISFSRLPARSQRARKSFPWNQAVARDSKHVKPEARSTQIEEDEGEAEPEIGLALIDGHKDPGRQATIESDPEEPNGFSVSDVRHDSPPSMAQSPDPRPPSRTSNTHKTFGGAEPSDILGHANDSTRVVSAQQTPAPAEAVPTNSPIVHTVDTHITAPDCVRATRDAPNSSCDAGPPNIPSVATASVNFYGARVLPAVNEYLATNRAVHETKSTTIAPTVDLQSSPERDEEPRNDLALAAQDQGISVENELHRSEQPLAERDDIDAVMLFVERASNNIWNRLSKDYPQRTPDQWRRLFLNRILPVFDLNRVITSLVPRKPDQYSSGRCMQSDQSVQPPRTENHAVLDFANGMQNTSPIAHTPETQNGAQSNATQPLSGATQGQPLHPQAYIQGSMRFTNCDQVNIATNSAQSGGSLPTDSGRSFASTIVAGDLVFEGCKEVNILTPPRPVIPVQKRQRRSHKPTRRPEQPIRKHPQPQPQSPGAHQHQASSQHPPPAPPFAQPAQSNAPLRTFAQPNPPTQLPTQPQSYGPTVQFHTHDPHYSQAYQAGPSQAQGHAPSQSHLWAHRHFDMPLQTAQAQRFLDPSQYVQQTVSDARPQAYTYPPQTDYGAQHSMPPQTQTQRFHDPLQHVQQTVSDTRPQAYSHSMRTDVWFQHQPTHRDEATLPREESRRWGRQALQEINGIERDRYHEADDDNEDGDDEEFEEYEEGEDDEEY